jgi:hypothetical protein
MPPPAIQMRLPTNYPTKHPRPGMVFFAPFLTAIRAAKKYLHTSGICNLTSDQPWMGRLQRSFVEQPSSTLGRLLHRRAAPAP